MCSFRDYFTSSRSCFFFFFSCPIYLFFVWVTCFVFCVCVCVCLIELFFSFFDVVCFLLFREKKTCLNLQKCFVFFRREFRQEENKHKIEIFFLLLYACTCMCVLVWVSFGAHTSTKKMPFSLVQVLLLTNSISIFYYYNLFP